MKISALLIAFAATLHAAPPEPNFRAVTIDEKIQIGYGVAVADVDGDKHPDILLADKKQFVWYRNPGAEKSGDPAAWAKFILAENLTKNDNVCLAAQDIDGDGKCEIAVGAEWNPGDTVNSGAVFYLIAPEDRTQKWEPVKFPSVEPTTHRMRWIRLNNDSWGLLVSPLHGRGNKNGEGAAVKVLCYRKPSDARGEWQSEVVDESMHMTHNFHVRRLTESTLGAATVIWIGGREGLTQVQETQDGWRGGLFAKNDGPQNGSRGIGEFRFGLKLNGMGFFAAVEPMHGNELVVYRDSTPKSDSGLFRHVLTEKLTEGHALACGDLLGIGGDQIVVGWRGTPGKEGSTFGLHVWTALDEAGKEWRDSAVDDSGMACEDLVLADLNGDGKLDIIASGRATKNVKVYFNETLR